MSDEDLQRFYERAAHDEAFREALWSDPGGTIDSTDLAPHVKAMLKSVSPEELAVMVRKATGMKPPLWGTIIKVALGAAAACVVVGLLLPPCIPGPRESTYEARAARILHQIAMAEEVYKTQYGQYGTLENLRGMTDSSEFFEGILSEDEPYEFIVTTDGATFTAIARHKTRPETRKAYTVGPDSEVREVVPQQEEGGKKP